VQRRAPARPLFAFLPLASVDQFSRRPASLALRRLLMLPRPSFLAIAIASAAGQGGGV